MSTKKYSFEDHPEHEAQLPAWRDKWIKIALSTEPLSDFPAITAAVYGLYDSAKLPRPRTVLFCRGPLSGAIAAGIGATAITLISQNRSLEQSVLFAAVDDVVVQAVAHAMPTEDYSDSDRASVVAHVAETIKSVAAPAFDMPRQNRPDADLSNIRKTLRDGVESWTSFYQGGNTWAGHAAQISFFRHVAKLDLPEYEAWQHYEYLAEHTGWRYVHDLFAIVCERPAYIAPDYERPHRARGPFTIWRDGFRAYYLCGVAVSRKVAMGEFSAKDVLNESNVELRRVMVDIYGASKWLADVGAEVLHSDEDQYGRPRRLLRVESPDDEPFVAVEVINSTPEPEELSLEGQEVWQGPWVCDDGEIRQRNFKVYRLRVHPELIPLPRAGRADGKPQKMTCHNAIASTFGLRGEDYSPIEES